MQARDALLQEPQGARARLHHAAPEGAARPGSGTGKDTLTPVGAADAPGRAGERRTPRATAQPRPTSSETRALEGGSSAAGPPAALQRGGGQTLLPGSTVQRTHRGPGGHGEGSRRREALTVSLHGCSPLHQVVGQLHGVGGAKRELPREPDDQNAHQRVLQDGHLRAEAEEEAAGRAGRGGLVGAHPQGRGSPSSSLIWAQRGHCPPSPWSLVPDAHVDRAPQPCRGL